MLNYIKSEIMKKFNFDVNKFFENSKLIKKFKTQTKLRQFQG